jgi:hypothetical protein
MRHLMQMGWVAPQVLLAPQVVVLIAGDTQMQWMLAASRGCMQGGAGVRCRPVHTSSCVHNSSMVRAAAAAAVGTAATAVTLLLARPAVLVVVGTCPPACL